jgi:hypothetical protein
MQKEISEALRKNHERRIKEALDLIWMYLRLETLEAEINKRFENADTETRVRIQYVNN